MNSKWLLCAILRAASLLVPRDERAEWLVEWRTELWYVQRREAMLFCLGSFRDALWLRWNNATPATRTRIHLESPLSCLAFLAVVAAMGVFIAVCLLGPLKLRAPFWRLGPGDLPGGCIITLVLSCLLLPATRTLGHGSDNSSSMLWPGRLRRGTFLALKVVLMQPMMLCGLLVWILIAPVAPFAPLGILAAWILALRWISMDQQRRCPVCLRLLIKPVRVGTPSRTFLEWHGAESMCPHGHGLQYHSEVSSSYSRSTQWLCLDSSWGGLFSAATKGRNHDA